MAANLKGNLGLKSSPLAPTACKLSTQHLVLDHMTNHYNKISRAKSAIDSKPPKSLLTSQKMRDRKNRERLINSPRQRPASSPLYNELDAYHDILDEEPLDDEERLVHSIMRNTLIDKPKGSNNATYGSSSQVESYGYDTHISRQNNHRGIDPRYRGTYGMTNNARPGSARSVRSGHSLASMTSRVTITTHDPAKITYQGDVLDKRSHVFTEERPFTPRTLKTNHESRLKSSKCYNPPRSRSSVKEPVHGSNNMASENTRPKAPPRRRKVDVSPSQDYSNQDLQDTMDTNQLSDTMLMDITLQSRDGRHSQEPSHKIPPLAISMDKDHMNWIQEQASKAEVRARSHGQLRSSIHSDEELRPVRQENRRSREAAHLETVKNVQGSSSYRSLASISSASSWISQRLMEEEEEQKYLEFAKEVTDSVLSRGISTDSVIERVFENFIERRKHELDEDRMRSVIRDIRKDLGLRSSSIERSSKASMSDYNYSNKFGSQGAINGSSSDHQNNSSSKSTTFKEDSLSFDQMNGGASSTLEPLNVMTSNSEKDLSTTLDSTSTMKFGRTGDMFSTINSEATGEAREEERDKMDAESDLSVTQALKQYQFDLTVKEASGEISTSARESETANSNGGEKSSLEHTSKLQRPATGERRLEDEEESRSDTSSIKGLEQNSAGSSHRTRRRERFRKTKELENSSSAASQPSSEHTVGKHTSDELYSSDKSVIDVTLHSGSQNGASNGQGESPDVADDGETSVKSSASSQRPAVRPRARARKDIPGIHQQEETHSHKQENGGHVVEEERGRELHSAREEKIDHSNSSAPGDSGVGSGHAGAGHDDTLEDASDAAKNLEQKKSPGSPAHSAEPDDEYEDDYEDDYDGDEDDGQGTHRTSDDDF